jgi:spore maturation protein CgeB
MVGRVIRTLGSMVYGYAKVPEDVVGQGPFGRLKVALIADLFTTECLSAECRIRHVTPGNYREVIQSWKPDILFAESVFHGAGGSWRYELAKQPKYLRWDKPKAIFDVVEYARSRGVPTVFWNKDDGAYFDAFIDVARGFDYVFTTDRECLGRYRERLDSGVPVNTLMMAYQPSYHDFTGFNFECREACFTGSYYRNILGQRRQFLDMVFDVTRDADLPLNVYDRNHDRFSRYFAFRYPTQPHMKVHPKVPHVETGRIYKSHVASINVNSVTESETMCSRRLLEILACGGIAVTNPSLCVDKHFRDFCHVVSAPEEARETFCRLKFGPSTEDMERAEAGARHVRQFHTWEHRLEEICAVVKR